LSKSPRLEKYRLSGRIKSQNKEKAIRKGFKLLERVFMITLGAEIRFLNDIEPDQIARRYDLFTPNR
jgi:hypothetical protein